MEANNRISASNNMLIPNKSMYLVGKEGMSHCTPYIDMDTGSLCFQQAFLEA